MELRSGVAASAAASILFAVLLLSNAVLDACSEQRARLALLSRAGSSLQAQAIALEGVAVTRILDQAQMVLSRGQFDCSTAINAAVNGVTAISTSLHEMGVAVNASFVGPVDLGSGDNLTSLGPFSGGVRGLFDLGVSVTASGDALGGAVSYRRSEQHTVHLPFDPERAVTLCAEAARDVEVDFRTSVESSCNMTAVDSFSLVEGQKLSGSAAAEHLSLSLTHVFLEVQPCSVDFKLDVAETGIPGPLGPFSWMVSTHVVLQQS